jgi:hypothetical protein
MKYSSIVSDLIRRFSSLDIIIEPEESAVREAVNKLIGSNPKYFEGVKKVVVEHDVPHSPYLGKSTGEGIIYISLDAIRNQLKSQGEEHNQQAFIHELVKTLGHEVAHIRGGMEHTEGPSEVEEQVLEQKFPMPALKREAADLTDKQRRAIVLQKEIAALQGQLNQIQTVWKQLTKPGIKVDPAREVHFKAEQDRINNEITARRSEIESLEKLEQAVTKETISDEKAAPKSPAVTNVNDLARYGPLFKDLAASLGSALSGLVKLYQLLNGAPDFVKGEGKILPRMKEVISSTDALYKKMSSRIQAHTDAPHLLKELALEILFEETSESLLDTGDFLTSEQDFITPLTNQGVESDFYKNAIAPLVNEILASITRAAAVVGSEHKSILQIPELSTSKLPSAQKNIGKPQRETKSHGERTLSTIREDYLNEFSGLTDKLEGARRLWKNTADQSKLAPLLTRKDQLEAELQIAKQELSDAFADVTALSGTPRTKEQAAKQRASSERYQMAKRRVKDAEDELSALKTKISSLYDTSAVNADDLIAAIAPYSNVASVEARLKTVSEKLEQFKLLDEYKRQLTERREELLSKSKELGEGNPDVKALTALVEVSLPKQIAEIEGDLGASSSPKSREKDPNEKRIRDDIKANTKLLNSPLVRSIFDKLMPDMASGGDLRTQKKNLERKIKVRTQDVAPETDYDELKGVLPADVEISTWQSQIADVDRDIKYRKRTEIIDYIGRLGQALSAIVQRAAGKSDVAIPTDILGKSLRLGKYIGADGNAKIIRDLESVVNANMKAVGPIEAELGKLRDELANIKRSPKKDEVKAERLKAKYKYLSEQPAFKKLRSDISSTIERLVQHTSPIVTEEVSQPKIVTEREDAPDISDKLRRRREKEERNIAKEFGWKTELPSQEESTKFPEYDERSKAVSRQWEAPEPLGKSTLTNAIKQDIERGLIDPTKIPSDVRKQLLTQLHATSGELRSIKERLVTPDAELADLQKEEAAFRLDTSVDPDFNNKRIEQNMAKQESLRRSSAKLREQAKRLHAEISKIRDVLKDPEKYVRGTGELEKDLEKQLERQEARLLHQYKLEDSIKKLRDDLLYADPLQLKNIQKTIAIQEAELKSVIKEIAEADASIDRTTRQLSSARKKHSTESDKPSPIKEKSVRVYEPTEEERAAAKLHRQRYEAAVDKSVEEKAKRYRAADEAERRTIAERRKFVDPNKPEKQLPSTRMLNAARAMRYAYKKALELNPKAATSRESKVRDALYRQTELDNYLRVLDDEYLKQATERALSETSDIQEQFKLRTKYLDELHKAPEYTQGLEMLQQAMNDLDNASIIDRPEGTAALESVVEPRDMGKGVGRVRGKPERMLGAKDPYMLFFRAQYEAEIALMRYEEAAKAKKHLDKVAAKARKDASDAGLDEKQINETVDREYNEMLGGIMAAQYESLSKFDNIVDKLKESTQGKKPTVFFDPTKVESYLKDLADKQAAAVHEKELARRFIQVREIPLLTAGTFDPDRYPKLLAAEFSDEMPPMSELARQQRGGEGVYKKLRYVLPHLLWGQTTPGKKGKKGEGAADVPAEVAGLQESPFTEAVKKRYTPAPIRPGGKGQRGQNVPQFMQSKSRS